MTTRTSVRPPERSLKRLEGLLEEAAPAVAGLPTIVSQSFFLAASPLAQAGVLWLTRGPEERDQLMNVLRCWFARGSGDTPQLLTIGNGMTPANLLPSLLLQLLDGEPVWLIATSDDLRLPLPTPELLRKQTVALRPGDACDPGELSQQLITLGYTLQSRVMEPGTFARRGGLVDAWPLGEAQPLRLDLIDSKIESLKTFHWKTQQNSGDLETALLTPCQLPKANQATILHYLRERKQRMRVVGPERDEMVALDPEAEATLKKLEDFPSLTFLPFASEDALFDVQPAPLFQKNFDRAAAFLKERASSEVTVLSTRPDEVRERLGSRVTVLPLDDSERGLVTGFASKKDRFVVLTDWELYGPEEEERESRRSERADIIFLAELKPGDYVVHLDHGIGRFQGTSVQDVNGEPREYFIVMYAGDDKLMIPVELADKLSKYIGLAHPKLHRLSGSGWYQMKRKIKEETRAIAEELLKLYAQRETASALSFGKRTGEEQELAENFPYDITPDQAKAIEDIEHDLEGKRPMDRLICGDVGFGKTEVAIRAAFKAVANKKQVAILSPTTILTQQHFDTFSERLKPFKVRIEQLSRFRSPKQQEETLARLKLGEVDIVIGTHRLLQNDVQFKDLGLVIIDEEQRFGVQHKERLKTLRLQTHVLTLTATPIPRTLNLALAGIRDITVIETPPEGRKPIETHIDPYHDNIVQRACERELGRGGQVYFVYNNVTSIALRRRELQFLMPKARFGIAHGQMNEEELASVMADFDQKKIDILLCSTIIENGLDLPNVNTLIVDHATNFGLAQLYQLRGRIGRGQNQAFAYFLYHAKKLSAEARKRLQALLEARELGSGFRLALRDLEIRGTGSILGQKQHGHVAAVGLTLYARLLAETIQEIKDGVTAQPTHDILLDLPLSIRIPKEIEPNEQKRLSFYQKLALETTVEGLERRASRLFRRKVLPDPIRNLVDVLKLKLLGQPINVTRIAMTKTFRSDGQILLVEFSDSLIPAQIKALIDDNPDWQFTQHSIKIAATAFGDRWMEALHTTFTLLEKARHAKLDPAAAKA